MKLPSLAHYILRAAEAKYVTRRPDVQVSASSAAPANAETFQCEHCEQRAPIEEIVRMVDVPYCAKCAAAWDAIFRACPHDWEHGYVAEDGSVGKVCRKCHGFVNYEEPRRRQAQGA